MPEAETKATKQAASNDRCGGREIKGWNTVRREAESQVAEADLEVAETGHFLGKELG